MTCRVDRNKYQIQIPLPPKIDPTVTMMTVEEKPDVTYSGEHTPDIRALPVLGGRPASDMLCLARCWSLQRALAQAPWSLIALVELFLSMGSSLRQPNQGRARSQRSQHGQSFQRPRTLSKVPAAAAVWLRQPTLQWPDACVGYGDALSMPLIMI